MKNAEIIKNTVTDGDMELINKYSRRPLSADEVYTFSVILCDNDIDRDNERFTEAALESLAELFVGKTGIFDHSMRGRDQVARIYYCETVKTGELLGDGSEYVCLKARAYIPRTSKNEDFILSLDTGIIKEVSVGCAVKREICSICGKNLREDYCEHKKGAVYNLSGEKKLCYTLLDDPYDAYEWSFVAVPSQRRAGVVKSYKGEISMDIANKVKSFGEGEVTLSAAEGKLIKAEIENLKKSHQDYLDDLKKQAVKGLFDVLPALSGEVLDGILDKLDAAELKSITAAAKEKSVSEIQLGNTKNETHENFDSFIL